MAVLALKMASSCSVGLLSVVAHFAPEDVLANVLARLSRYLVIMRFRMIMTKLTMMAMKVSVIMRIMLRL